MGAANKKRFQTILILGFSGLCLANMLAGIFPENSDTGKSLIKKLGGIRWTSGTWQRWGMFHTIPTLHRFRFQIVAKDAGGEEHEFGAGLPALRQIEPREEIRYHYAFLRMFDTDPEFLGPYVQMVANELRKADPGLVEFSVAIEFEFTRHLFHIRKDGKMSVLESRVYGPYTLNDE